jgi:leucyl aminopeptidase
MGARLKSYAFNHYRTKDLAEFESKLKKVTIATTDATGAKKAWAPLEAVANGMFLARDLVNEPPNVLFPAEFAKRCRTLSKLGVKVEVLGVADMTKLGMGALLGVGQGSERESQLVVMKWNGGRKKDAPVAFVGKGVCFDSGGLDIKTAEGMRLMKKDMGGAAHALALARLIMQRKLPIRLHCLVPTVENAISGNAYRPGDVVRTRKGLNVEIGNTDAEGRVILCDALAYAVEHKPRTIIDFATLTGAARVALGPELPVLFCNDEKLAAKMLARSVELEDPMWRLPLWRNYRRLFDSDIADFNNSGRGGFGGAIVAALFLDYFVPQDIAWAHFDVFAWNDASRPGRPLGGEAQGLRAILAALA